MHFTRVDANREDYRRSFSALGPMLGTEVEKLDQPKRCPKRTLTAGMDSRSHDEMFREERRRKWELQLWQISM